MYIATHPHNNSLVVLIHGVMSNRYMAWAAAIDMIQTIHHQGSGTLRSYDFYAFEYSSGFLHQPALDRCFAGLRKLIAQPRYDTVVLIGHSQGGVAAKLFIIEELENSRGRELKVDIVMTLDSPHRGPQPWIYPLVVAGGIWKRVPLVNRVPVFRQVADLGIGSAQLRKLKRCWTEANIPSQPIAPEPTRRHLRSYTVCGQTFRFPRIKIVVSDRSARGFEIDQRLPDSGVKGAWGLGHGITAMDSYRHEIERILGAHDAEHITELETQVASVPLAVLEDLLTPHCPPGEVACESQSWKRRLVRSFAIQPLRKIGMQHLVEKFVKLRLGHP